MLVDREKVDRLCQADFEFFRKLVSAYHAIHHVCPNPVVVSLEAPYPIKGGVMYYDCASDEEAALAVVKKRIEIGSDDIRQHLNLMQLMLEDFSGLKESAFVGEREKVVEQTLNFSGNLGDYIELVNDHETRLGDYSFLVYPSAVPGHFANFQHTPHVGEIVFNGSNSAIGSQVYLNDLRRNLERFKLRKDPMRVYINEFEFAVDDRLDSSLKGVLGVTKQLLSRAGYKG